MAAIQEYYRPQPMAADTSYRINGIHMAGFLAVTAGTITVTDVNGTVLLAAMPIAVGATSIPMMFGHPGGANVQLGGGASGTLLI